MVDFIPDEVEAVLAGRGGWTYAGDALTGASKIKAVGYFEGNSSHPSGKLIAIDDQPTMWDVVSASSITGTPGAPIAPPVFHRGKLIFPCDAAVPTYYDGSTTLSTLSSAPEGKTVAVYKDHLVLGGVPTNSQRVYFSDPGDPTSWDTSFGYWDATGAIYAIAGLTNSILIFHADSVERLRGTTPPPGSDMILEPFLVDVGIIDPYSLASWQDRVVWAASTGIYMTDGASVVDLTASSGMKSYWNDIVADFDTPLTGNFRIAGGVYRNHYIISVYTQVPLAGGTSRTIQDTLCINLERQTMWRFSNVIGSSFIGTQFQKQEKLYMGLWTDGRVAELSSLWSPATAVKEDGDSNDPTPILETAMYRGYDKVNRRSIESMGKQKWRWVYVDYDLRDALADDPTAALSYCTSPTGSYTQAGSDFAETTDISRVKRALNPTQGGATRSQMMGFKFEVTGPYKNAKLYALEADFEPIGTGRL